MHRSILLFSLCLLIGAGHSELFAQLPEPSGPNCIGKSRLHLVDSTRYEDLTELPDDFRALVADVWYPGKCTGRRAPYIHPEILNQYRRARRQSQGLDLSFMSNTVTHSYLESDVSLTANPAPVLIFSPGANTPLELYTSLFESLASNGYIVFGISHTYEAPAVESINGDFVYRKQEYYDRQFNDQVTRQLNDVMEYVKSDVSLEEKLSRIKNVFDADFPTTINVKRRAQDISSVVSSVLALNEDEGSPFYRKLNPERIGGFGHSFGGAAIGQAHLLDSRLKAAINLDGWQFGEVAGKAFHRPFLYIRGGSEQPDPFNTVVYSRAGEHFAQIKMEGTSHENFSDLPLFPGANTFADLGPLEGIRNVLILNTLIQSYFDYHLRGDRQDWESTISSYPELVFEVK